MPSNGNSEVEPNTLTVNDLMARWKCPRKRILEAIHDKRLAAFKVGRRVFRVTIAEVERFENARAA